MPYFHKNGCNSETTEVIYMAVELDQDSIATNMYVKLGENLTNTLQEFDYTKFSGCTYVRLDKGNSICLHFVGA